MGIAHISKEIEANKNNPKKLKEIIKNLTIRSKNAIHNLNEGLKNNVPGYKKTAHFLHAVSELTIIHHATHQLS
ncbi:hypothetical protein KA037_01440 [Patescibacteria group bacterium]|nr:hypothetical protein [Patescibacteria group bacterium]MBP7841326.1 hypothetical protein [Patescibacteria group bacterium]